MTPARRREGDRAAMTPARRREGRAAAMAPARRRERRSAAMTPALEAKIAAARAVGALARRARRGGGTSLPGKLLMFLEPNAIAELAARLPEGSLIVSATNGKTTTSAMIASILTGEGLTLVHNRAGANMAGGVASALLQAARPRNRMDGQLGLFEVDEFWLERVAAELAPRALLLANLFRDQLDRYGELDAIADRWAAVVAGVATGTALVLNADDPLVADLGREAANVTYFGIEDSSVAIPEMQHASDSKHCRRCGAAYVYEAIYLGHQGRYRCPGCGRERPQPQIAAGEIVLEGTRAARFTLRTPAGVVPVALPLPGLYNVYNALGAAALCLALGVPLGRVKAGLERVTAAFGRAETIAVDGASLVILLVKNPVGANEILRTLALEHGELELLAILNDRTADGHDVSWIWDADFELLAARVAGVTCAGTRAAELALRLKYAGVPPQRLRVRHELRPALDEALARVKAGAAPPDVRAGAAPPDVKAGAAPPGVGAGAAPAGAGGAPPLFVLPTYTALLELREELSRRGHVSQFWEDA